MKKIVPYLFVLPYFLLFIIFFLIPAFMIIPMSFTNWNIIDPPKLIGFTNYKNLFNDPYIWKTIKNTFVYTILVTLFLTVLSLCIANIINQKAPGRTLSRVTVLVPYVISSTVAGTIWKWMYNNSYGVINEILKSLHLQPVNWLSDDKVALLAIVLMNIWWSIGFNTIIYLAAIQGIPDDLYQAAIVDGAGPLQCFRYITIPMLRPITLYVVVMCAANSFQMFDEAFIMTQGGPVGATTTLVYKMYNSSFVKFKFGEGSAVTVITTIFILIFTVIQLKMANKSGDEGGLI